ncbi:MAG: 3-keto-disaccharide hydrolase [Planctomycetaceae bacterium]
MRLQIIAAAVFCPAIQGLASGNDAEFRPLQDTLPVPAPPDAIVLFDGSTNRFVSMSGGEIDWPIEQGCLVSTKGGKRVNHIVSQLHFRDAEIHVEFAVDAKGGGNSGVYLHGHYELQIYDSFGKDRVSEHDEGALYGFAKPLVNASRPVGQWQVYDIRYRAPRRDADGKIIEPGALTAWLNGQKVQDETRFGEPKSVYHPFRYGTTPYLEAIAERMRQTQVGPLFLQDHDSPTRFRNIWVRPLDDKSFFNPGSDAQAQGDASTIRPDRSDADRK